MLVWAFQPIQELNFQVGFVQVEDELAKQLIEAEEVQDFNVGHENFKHITNVVYERPVQDYDTKDMKPKSRKKAND